MKTLPIFIGGEWVQAEHGGSREVLNPANGECLALVADGAQHEVDHAVAFARKAFDEGPWPRMRAQSRISSTSTPTISR
jgi:acyl-CoA reductase-like NAD-dependent aldehyde dehydrogenase